MAHRAGGTVTRSTQHWSCLHQQLVSIGAMRTVAIHAVLAHRGMLPEERPALFSVAGVADVVDGIGFQQLLSGASMWVVAIHTTHLALGYWHMRLLAELGALLLVAGLAGFSDAGFFHQAVGREPRHRVVAVGAGQLVGGMRGARPVDALTSRMAIQALAGLFGNGCAPFLGKTNDQVFVLGVCHMQ